MDFKEWIKDYFLDKKAGSLKKKFKSSSTKDKQYKEYFIPFQIEKNKLVKHLHEQSIHKSNNILYELIKYNNFWWSGIYDGVKECIKACIICQDMYKSVSRKPQIKQMITKGPRERYVVSLVDIDEEINDIKIEYQYILNIIDHYSKLVGSYLLKKTAEEVLIKIRA